MRSYLILIFICQFIFDTFSQKTDMMMQIGHSDRVTCSDYSHNGEYVVTGGMDQVLKLWEVKTGLLVRTYKGHRGMVYQVKFSPDGNYLYSCSYDDKSIIKWDVKNGNILIKKLFNNIEVSDFAISNDGSKLAASGNDTVLILKGDLSVLKRLPITSPGPLFFNSLNELFVASNDYSKPKISCYSNTFVLKDEIPTIESIEYMNFENGNLLISNYQKVMLMSLSTKSSKVIFEKDSVNISACLLLRDGVSVVFSLMDGRIFKSTISGEKELLKTKHNAMVRQFNSSKDGKYLVSASYDWSAQIVDIATGSNVKWLRSNCDYINHFSMSETGMSIAFSSGNITVGNQIGIWDLQSAKVRMTNKKENPSDIFQNIAFNEKSNSIVAANSNGQSYWFNFPATSTSWNFMSGNSEARCSALTPNGKNGVVGTRDGKLIFWRPERNKTEIIDVCKDGITSVEISPDGMMVILGTDSGQLILVDYTNKTVLSKIESHSSLAGYYDTTWVMSYGSITRMNIFGESGTIALNSISISDIAINKLGNQIAVCGGNWVNIFDAKTGERINQFVQIGAGFGCVNFSNDGNKIVVSGADGIVRIFNLLKNEIEIEFIGHENEVRAVCFSKLDNFVISGSLDSQLKIWNLSTKKELLSLVTSEGGTEFIIYNPSGYYFATKGATSLVSYRIGQKVYPFVQFDLQFNRPDLIMTDLSIFTASELGKPISVNLIRSYKNAYLKRLQRMRFTENELVNEVHAPTITIKRENAKLSTADSLLKFQLVANDSKYDLRTVHVCVNGVPIFGMKGFTVTGKSTIKNVETYLSYGLNKVSVYCINNKTVKSLVETFDIVYTPSVKEDSKTYYIGIGVQEYSDTNFNLKYSSKDVVEVGQLFSEKFTNSENIVLTNSEVTRENILKIKDVLLKTNVNDEVVVLLSGHGLLSDELDFYYATHNMNFENPKENGILFEDIESLLDGIPARKKMLLMDACHSGELDKSEVVADPKQNNAVGAKVVGSKGQKMMMGLTNSFDLMKDLFSDLQSGTGTTVIASSSGKYFSFEYDEYKNGVFTYSLKEALSGKADINNDSQISVSELQSYLSKRVLEITKGKQEPTSRKINLEVDWRVW